MKILVGLTEHIGDIIACEPVSRYLRLKYPEAHITWVVFAAYRALIDGNPNIDETLVVDCLTDWIKITKHQKVDQVVDLHVNYRVCPHCRIPLIKHHGNPQVNAYEWFDHGALLEAFSFGAGLPKLSAQPQMYIDDDTRAAVDALKLPERYCVIHRVSTSVEKDWRAENWPRLVRWIADSLKLPVVEIGAGLAAPHLPLPEVAIDLHRKTSILQTAEVIRRASLFIGVDSGPAHMANAMRTPGVVMLGRIGVFRQYNPYTGLYASNSHFVKLVRNASGPASDLPFEAVQSAVRYLAEIVSASRNPDLQHALTAVRAESPPPSPAPAVPVGEKDRLAVSRSELWDPAWYALEHPEINERGAGLLDYYLTHGNRLGHAPGPHFDAVEYLRKNPDVARSGSNALLHFVLWGEREGRGRSGKDQEAVALSARAKFEDVAPPPIPGYAAVPFPASPQSPRLADAGPAAAIPKVFAFYLPQFHPIAENNIAHAMGFTEWTNIIKAEPLFSGHHQPRVPGELGYYDLRAFDVMREQVSLALEHGISGFCFYYYYFKGTRLLYKPIENYINSDLTAPFFFLWANENWSKRWDGGNHEVIIAQSHSPEDDLVFIRDLLPTFADARYVKIDGKPLLLIYKTQLFPDIRQTVDIWRDEVVRQGWPGIYLVMVDDWTQDPVHPRSLGFDASYEIPSNLVPECTLSHEALDLDEAFTGRIVDYEKFAHYHMARPGPEYRRFRTVMLPWDNTPRYGQRAMVHINTGGSAYRNWLTKAMLDTQQQSRAGEEIVLLHSWNEWCEGTYVEPDQKFGRHFLEETRAAIADATDILELSRHPGEARGVALLRELQRVADDGVFRVVQAQRAYMGELFRHLDLQGNQIGDLRREVDALRSSTSWRITAPLRAIVDRLRR